MLGLAVGWGLTQFVRKSASFILRREAMGFGDVTLMGMIGAFHGLAGRGAHFFSGSVLWPGTCELEVVQVLEEMD